MRFGRIERALLTVWATIGGEIAVAGDCTHCKMAISIAKIARFLTIMELNSRPHDATTPANTADRSQPGLSSATRLNLSALARSAS